VTAALSLVTEERRARIGSLPMDPVDLNGALEIIDRLVQSGRGGTVFTPNVDHVVMAESNERLRRAYHAASLSLVDGTPVLWASHLLSQPLPAKVSGSDLVMPLMELAARKGYRVYLLGGAPGVAHKAKLKLEQAFPGLEIVGVDDSFVDVDALAPKIIERIQKAKPHILLAALGAPKQEIFAFEQRKLLKPAVVVGVGASLDFVAGVRKRAPRWISKIGLEWFYRLIQEPRRLARRYLLRDPKFCVIVLRQLMEGQAA
jgi:N-acetylglucosaminyldiphosphoundecaprenol N-acetyl-beta-D-mannosaminyltransferase